MLTFEEYQEAMTMIRGLFDELGQISINTTSSAKGFRENALRHLDELYQRVLDYPGSRDNASIVEGAKAVRVALEAL